MNCLILETFQKCWKKSVDRVKEFFHSKLACKGASNKSNRSNDPPHSFHVYKVVLVYPCDGAVPMTTMTTSRAAEIQKMVFIDSTWAQAKQIYKDPRLKGKVEFISTVAAIQQNAENIEGKGLPKSKRK